MFRKSLCFLSCILLSFSPLQAKEVYPGGESVGIQVNYDGVLISGTYTFTVDEQQYDPSKEFKANDLLTSINGVHIHTLEDMSTQLLRYQEAVNKIPVEVQRNGATLALTLTTVYLPSQGSFRSGLYVKDKITGVGTISYYDPDGNSYGALGHEIMDIDTNQQAEVHTGTIYPAEVNAIQKAKENVPGEKQATIDFSKVLGDVKKNSVFGIFGQYQVLPENKVRMEIAAQKDVHPGKAVIYTVLHGNQLEVYQVEITKCHKQKERDTKGIELTVTDPALKQQTNGIIQGMSGSPILQDGKIVGALTHVITNDPMRGYGVYLDWMLEESQD